MSQPYIVPPFGLQLTCTARKIVATTISGNNIKPATFSLYKPQAHVGGFYGISNIRKGDWIAAYGSLASHAYCWRIVDIINATSTSIELTMEDVGNYNKSLDTNNGDIVVNAKCIVFRLDSDGMPELTGVYGMLPPDGSDKTFIADVRGRFSVQSIQRQRINVYRPSHGLTVGIPIYINESGNYVRTTETTSTKTIGVVSSTGIPNSDWFSYKAFGTLYLDTGRFFTGISLSAYGSTGTYLYLHATPEAAASASLPYTTTPVSSASLPVWVYLGREPTSGTEIGMLFLNNYSATTGSQGDIGSQGAIGDTGSQGAIGATGSQGAIGDTGSQGAIGATGSQGAVSYTHLTLPTKRIV